MAVTPVIVKRSTSGSLRQRIVDVQFDSSYPTGGETLLPSDIELGTIHAVFMSSAGGVGTDDGREVRYDLTSQKLKVYVAAGTETINATDLSGFYTRLLVLGA